MNLEQIQITIVYVVLAAIGLILAAFRLISLLQNNNPSNYLPVLRRIETAVSETEDRILSAGGATTSYVGKTVRKKCESEEKLIIEQSKLRVYFRDGFSTIDGLKQSYVMKTETGEWKEINEE